MGLRERLTVFNADFERQTGEPFRHFFCPILRVDEDAALCMGHVIPKSLGGTLWVPQRSDVDNFFGYVAEADFSFAVSDRNAGVTDMFLDPILRKRHSPKLEYMGQGIEYYFPKEFKDIEGHTPVHIAGADGTMQKAFVVKMSKEQFLELCEKDVTLKVERDYVAAVAASVLKAAHLTLFQMMRYEHVFSVPGLYLADILREFVLAHRGKPRKELDGELRKSFGPHSSMVLPVTMLDESVLRGTLNDHRMLACFGATTGIFAVGVIVKVATDMFCVFLPTDQGKAIDTYFSFLKNPPSSILVKVLQFRKCNDTGDSQWETDSGPPVRIGLQP